jgi:Uma2 family endonuclease
MSRASSSVPTYVADLLKRLGNIPASRVRLKPLPGTATERDVIALARHEGRLCELVDGTLVEKAMGFQESCLAVKLIRLLDNFVEQQDLGILAGEGGLTRLLPGLLRIPDTGFWSWKQLGRKEIPRVAVAPVAPLLAVEVISKGNTRQEIQRKLKEYFLAGTQLVWVVDPRKRLVTVYTAPDRFVILTKADTLDGGDVLPGFALPLRSLFTLLPQSPKKSGKAKRRRSA